MDRAEVIAIREKDVRLKQVGHRIVGYCGHVPEHIYYDRDRIDVPIHAEHPDKVALRAKKNAAASLNNTNTVGNNSVYSTHKQQQPHQMRSTFNGSQVRAAGTSSMVSHTGSSIAFSPTQSMGPKHAANDNTDEILATLAFPSRNNSNNNGKSVSPARGGPNGGGGGGPVYIERPRTPIEKLTPFPRYPVLRGPSLMTPSGLTNFLTN